MGVVDGVEALDWGIEIVLWFQQFSPALDSFFKSLTFLGNQEFFLLFMPLVYWCIDRRTGARLFILLLFSAYLNAVAKVLVDQPRPFDYNPRGNPSHMPMAADFPAVIPRTLLSSGDTWPFGFANPFSGCYAGLL